MGVKYLIGGDSKKIYEAKNMKVLKNKLKQQIFRFYQFFCWWMPKCQIGKLGKFSNIYYVFMDWNGGLK